MEEKINSPFRTDRKKSPGNKQGEKFYITRKAYLKFIETGKDENGKAVGTIDVEEVESTTNIKDLVNSHADEAGLQNIIKKYILTKDTNLFNARTPLPNGDYTQALKKPEEIYNKLPKEITKGRGIEDLLKNLSKEDLKTFAEALRNAEKKTEDTHNEEKE